MKVPARLFLAVTILLIAACNRDPNRQRDKYFNDAQRYLANGRYSEATIQFRNALQKDANHVPSYLGLAEVFRKTGDDAAAIGFYRKVVDLDPKNIPARLEVGKYFLNIAAGNSEVLQATESLAREIIEIEPSNIEGRILLGNVYSAQGRVEESIKELQAAVSQNPDHLQANISLGAAQVRAMNLEEAERIFKSVLEKHPDTIEAVLAMATFLEGTRRLDEAEAQFKKAFSLSPADARSLYGLASFYLSTQRASQAETVFKEAIAQKPDAREPRWGLANFYFQQGASDKATSTLVELLKAKPHDRQAQVRLAEAYLESKQQAKAEELIRSVLKDFPDEANAHALLGRLLRERNELDKAAAAFDAAIKSDESLIPPYIEKANLQMTSGNLEDARQTLALALQHHKDNMLVRGFLAKVFALQQKPQDAIREATIVLQAMPNNEDAIVGRADAWINLGNLKDAAKEFRRLTEVRPRYAYYWHRLGVAEALNDDNANAIPHLRKAIELKGDLKEAINDLVFFQVRSKQYDAALAELDRLLNTSLAPDEAHRMRGEVYMAKGDATAAVREFRKAIELNPESYANYLTLAQLNLAQGDVAQAMRDVDQLIAKNKQLPQALFTKAYILQLMNDNSQAVAHYRKALDLDPESAEISNNLAWLLAEAPASLPEAVTFAEKARRLRPMDPEMADTLGWVYFKTKNYSLAVDQLLFSVNNRTEPAAEHFYRLGAAYQAKGDLKQGEAMLRRALKMSKSFPGAGEAQRLLEKTP